jgi:hypothetical protein
MLRQLRVAHDFIDILSIGMALFSLAIACCEEATDSGHDVGPTLRGQGGSMLLSQRFAPNFRTS